MKRQKSSQFQCSTRQSLEPWFNRKSAARPPGKRPVRPTTRFGYGVFPGRC